VTFQTWLAQNKGSLIGADGKSTAALLNDALDSVGEGVAVEVADDGSEIIVTADGRKHRFAAAERVSQMLLDAGLPARALRPPRGFDFSLDADGVEIDASKLRFELSREDGNLALQLSGCPPMASREDGPGWADLVVQTGIGERLAAEVTYFSWTHKRLRSPIAELERGLREYLGQ
jgi:hypothetical protein